MCTYGMYDQNNMVKQLSSNEKKIQYELNRAGARASKPAGIGASAATNSVSFSASPLLCLSQ